MQTFLKKLKRLVEPIDLLPTRAFLRAVKALQQQYLEQVLMADPSTVKTSEQVESRRELRDAALYFELVLLEDSEVYNDGMIQALEVSATVFEFLERTTPVAEHQQWFHERGMVESILYGPLNDVLRAGLLYSLSGKQANASLMLKRLVDVSLSLFTQERRPEQTVVLGTLTILYQLMSGRPDDLEKALRNGHLLARLLHGNAYPHLVTIFGLLGLQCIEVIKGMLAGAPIDQTLSQALRPLTQAQQLVKMSLDPAADWLVALIERVLKNIHGASVRQVLAQYALPEQYLDQLISTGSPGLWMSQLSALEKGILRTRDNYAVELPTGAGKSLIAELLIVKEFHAVDNAWCVYLAPSRALVRQVEKDLRLRLPAMGIAVRSVLAGAERSEQIAEEIKTLSTGRSVTVLTPEKLETYLRFAPHLFSDCRLCILDEAHLLANDERGPRLELILSMLRIKNPELRIVCFSAVFSNPEEIASWLGNPEAYVKADWRPTRQLKALLVKDDRSVATVPNQLQVKYRGKYVPQQQAPNDQTLERRVYGSDSFELGLVLVRDKLDLDGLGRVFSIPKVANATRSRSRKVQASPGPWQYGGTGAPELAVEVAKRLLPLSERQLLFFGTPASAVKRAIELAQIMRDTGRTQGSDILKSVIETVRTLSDDADLLTCLEAGVAYHHSGMPTSVKRIVEVAAKKGIVKILCATSTLQEGVNVPAEIVIITGGKYFSDEHEKKREEMAVSNFDNIAGRAGRAFVSTEGIVVFVPEDYYSTGTTFQKQYMLTDPDDLKIKSALRAILDELDAWTESADDQQELSAPAQVVLLALNACGVTTEDELDKFVGLSFGGYTLPAHHKHRIARQAETVLSHYRKHLGDELLALFSQTGLSVTSCHRIYQALLLSFTDDAEVALRLDGRISQTMLQRLISALAVADELWENIRWSEQPTQVHAFLVHNWLTQVPLRTTLQDLLASTTFSRRPDLSDLIRYYASVENNLSWGFGVAYLFLAHIKGGACSKDVGLLPLYARYGVDTLTGAYVSLLGVSDRFAASALGGRFASQSDGTTTLTDVESWLQHLEVRDVEEALPGETARQSVVVDDLNLTVTSSTKQRVRAVLVCNTIPQSTFVNIRNVEGRVFAYDLDDRLVGEFSFSPELELVTSQRNCFGVLLSMQQGEVQVEVQPR